MSMFDSLKNLGGLGGLMAKAREMQEKMKTIQDELAKKTVSADAAAGVVTATVNGKLELMKVRIDKTKIDVNDTELLEDLIVAAVHAAQVKAADMIREEMGKAAGEMGLPPGMLPGM
jgi:DNA-binding YbaB/EbfC family protein